MRLTLLCQWVYLIQVLQKGGESMGYALFGFGVAVGVLCVVDCLCEQ